MDFKSKPVAPSSEAPAMPAPQRIADLRPADRPRERMLRGGPAVLSDAELLAIFFGSGTVGMNAIEMGRHFLHKYGNLTTLSRASVEELMGHRGMGPAKALHLAAACELGHRLAREQSHAVPLGTEEVVALLGPELRLEPVEVLKVVVLNSKHLLLGVDTISRGSLTETVAHPRDIMHAVVQRRGHRFIMMHNHPSGDPTPSAADRSMTQRVKQCADLFQVAFDDHIIIGQARGGLEGHFSFRKSGMLV